MLAPWAGLHTKFLNLFLTPVYVKTHEFHLTGHAMSKLIFWHMQIEKVPDQSAQPCSLIRAFAVHENICRQRRPRSDCPSTQSDQGLHCPLTESLDTTECMNREQSPRWYFAHAQDDLNLLIFASLKALYPLKRTICYFMLQTCRLKTRYKDLLRRGIWL